MNENIMLILGIGRSKIKLSKYASKINFDTTKMIALELFEKNQLETGKTFETKNV